MHFGNGAFFSQFIPMISEHFDISPVAAADEESIIIGHGKGIYDVGVGTQDE